MITPGTVNIHIISPSLAGAEGDSWLCNEELRRASAFKFEEDAQRWKSFRMGVRYVLSKQLGIHPSEVPIRIDAAGKPGLAIPFQSLHFNISHCDDLALLAISLEGPVGIDIEPIQRAPDLSECAETFCHPAEIAELPEQAQARARRLLELWCAKEALLKALGTGLLHAPDKIHLHALRGEFAIASDTELHGGCLLKTTLLSHRLLENHLAILSAPVSATRVEFSVPQLSTPPA